MLSKNFQSFVRRHYRFLYKRNFSTIDDECASARLRDCAIENEKDSKEKFFYPSSVEASINKQIKNEFEIAYTYLGLAVNFAQTKIYLPGFSHFFQTLSNEEVHHARLLMWYQNERGGKVSLDAIAKPTEVECCENALKAMELGLAKEQKNIENLTSVLKIAEMDGDDFTKDWIMQNLIQEQVADIRKMNSLIENLKSLPEDIGTHLLNRQLLKKYRLQNNEAICKVFIG